MLDSIYLIFVVFFFFVFYGFTFFYFQWLVRFCSLVSYLRIFCIVRLIFMHLAKVLIKMTKLLISTKTDFEREKTKINRTTTVQKVYFLLVRFSYNFWTVSTLVFLFFFYMYLCIYSTSPSTELKQNSFILTYENEFYFFAILNNRNEFTAHVHARKATP